MIPLKLAHRVYTTKDFDQVNESDSLNRRPYQKLKDLMNLFREIDFLLNSNIHHLDYLAKLPDCESR